jgi:hypothetical protein
MYLILNTEGKEYLYEIAIINPTGNPIYEAYAQGHPRTVDIHLKLKPLAQILTELKAIAFSFAAFSDSNPESLLALGTLAIAKQLPAHSHIANSQEEDRNGIKFLAVSL